MLAMVLRQAGLPLESEQRADPVPGPGMVRLKVEACAICRTDLHIVDGDLALPRLPVVPGHEVVGRVDLVGDGVLDVQVGERLGVPWLAGSCGRCRFCRMAQENLCDKPSFTGLTVDGGFATHIVVDPRYCMKLDSHAKASHLAPLMCAGLIGWRTLRAAGENVAKLGIYGFGAAAHLVTQVAVREGRQVYAFTRPGDRPAQELARRVGACWSGSSGERAPAEFDSALIFAPAGELVPIALGAVRKGGAVVCGGIHMSDIPSFPYSLLWGERRLSSVANLTRADAVQFQAAIRGMDLRTEITEFPLRLANDALALLRAGAIQGAAVLVP